MNLDNNIRCIDPIVSNYEHFIGIVKKTAKRYEVTNIYFAGIKKGLNLMPNIRGITKQELRASS